MTKALEVTSQAEYFQTLPQDKAILVKTLTFDVLSLEENVGRSLFEMGRKLKAIRTVLKEQGNPGAWDAWCTVFGYTKDYTNRMIQVADVFKVPEDVPANLTFRHFREVARFNYHNPSQEDIAKLARVVSTSDLSTTDTRKLISAVNKGAVDLDLTQLTEGSPKLKAELQAKLQEAQDMGMSEASKRMDILRQRVEEKSKQLNDVSAELQVKQARVKELAQQVVEREAASKLGAGDLELGKLKMNLEKEKHRNGSLQLALEEAGRDLQQSRYAYDRFMNSPAGQAKMDLKKTFEDMHKFFKDTMTPNYLALRVNKVDSPESRQAVVNLVEVVEQWTTQVRSLLEAK